MLRVVIVGHAGGGLPSLSPRSVIGENGKFIHI